MGQINIPALQLRFQTRNWSIKNTLVFPAGMVTPGYPPNVNGTLAGVTWVQNGPTAFPQPGTFDANAPTANPVLFGKQPPSLSAGGIQIGNSTVKNPA